MPNVLAYACDDTTSTFPKTTITLREPPGMAGTLEGLQEFGGRTCFGADVWSWAGPREDVVLTRTRRRLLPAVHLKTEELAKP